MTFLSPNEAQEYAALMRQAREIVGGDLDLDVDAEEAAREEFMVWSQDLGLRSVIARTLDDDGKMVWGIEIHTGRGKLAVHVADPRQWRQAVRDLGLA